VEEVVRVPDVRGRGDEAIGAGRETTLVYPEKQVEGRKGKKEGRWRKGERKGAGDQCPCLIKMVSAAVQGYTVAR